MIIGTFPWRGMQIEADIVINDLWGETIWLNRIDTGIRTQLAIIHFDRLCLTCFAPQDDLATVQLRSAFDAFRAEVSEAAA